MSTTAKQAPEQPDTLEQMTPLFYAVYHGCQADRHPEVRRDVYRERILHGNEVYLIHKLGASGTSLSQLANFFQSPWTAPIPSLSSADQAWVISESAFALRALSRLADAVDPMRAAAGARVKQASWRNAAVNYGNLSELLLTVGNVKEAIDTARMAVELTDRSGDWFQRMGKRAILADVLHQSGSMAASGRQFEEAEGLQTEQQPEYPVLYSVQGYRYCDFFLSRGQAAEVVRRASLTVRWVESRSWLLDIGLDHLSLGRAYPPGSADSAAHLNQAVEYLRRSGDTCLSLSSPAAPTTTSMKSSASRRRRSLG